MGGEGRHIALADCTVDLDALQVAGEGYTARLTEREGALLAYLVARAGHPVSRDELLTEVWGYSSKVRSRTVDTTVRRLRAKLREDRDYPRHVVTVYGEGYRFEPVDRPPPAEPPALPVLPALRFRDAELAAIRTALEDAAVVTVTGPAGVGKTALAVEVARQTPGAVFADLSHATDRGELLATLAHALGVRLGGGGTGAIAHALHERLVVLDGVGQGIDALGAWVAAWSAAAPGARLLVTARARLGLPDEVAVEVGPLPEEAATAVFLERARRVRPGWGTEADAGTVKALVTALDGLPLALELAAARAPVLSPAQMLRRLEDRFALLGAAPGTDRSLERALQSAWEPLSASARALLARCALLQGSFSLPLLEALVEPPDAPRVLDALQELVEHHLVRSLEPSRFALYRSVRDFALARLDPEEATRARARLVDALLPPREEPVGPDAVRLDAAGLAALELQRADRIALVAWGREHDPEVAARAALSLDLLLLVAGPAEVHARVLEEAVAVAGDVAPALRAALLRSLGYRRHLQGRHEEALAALAEARALAAGGPAALHARVLSTLGLVQLGRDPATALVTLDEAHGVAEAAGLRHLQGMALAFSGQAHDRLGQVTEAEGALTRALRLLRAEGDSERCGNVLFNLGSQFFHEGRHLEAEQCYEEALALHRALDNPGRDAIFHSTLASLRLVQGRLDAAESLYREALRLHRHVSSRRGQALVHGNLGWLSLLRGHREVAMAAFLEALRIARLVDDPRGVALATGNVGFAMHLAGDLDGALLRYQAALEHFPASGDRRAAAAVLGWSALARAHRGEAEAADEALERAAAAATGAREHHVVALCRAGVDALLAGGPPPPLPEGPPWPEATLAHRWLVWTLAPGERHRL